MAYIYPDIGVVDLQVLPHLQRTGVRPRNRYFLVSKHVHTFVGTFVCSAHARGAELCEREPEKPVVRLDRSCTQEAHSQNLKQILSNEPNVG